MGVAGELKVGGAGKLKKIFYQATIKPVNIEKKYRPYL